MVQADRGQIEPIRDVARVPDSGDRSASLVEDVQGTALAIQQIESLHPVEGDPRPSACGLRPGHHEFEPFPTRPMSVHTPEPPVQDVGAAACSRHVHRSPTGGISRRHGVSPLVQGTQDVEQREGR
jgi:hypothetical protein